MPLPLMQIDRDRTEHPVDIIERIAVLNHWPFERTERDEISISVAGSWTHYSVAFTWLAEVEALHIACAFDLNIPELAGPNLPRSFHSSMRNCGSAISTFGPTKG
jgi:hypothetical protein